MNWTVSVFGGDKRPPVHEASPDWEPAVIGTGHEVRHLISAHLPAVDWSNPIWGLYAGNGFTFEFSVGAEEPVTDFAVHVRGGGDAITDLLRFAVPNGWHLLDWSTMEFIDPNSPSAEGWKAWQAYRDRIRQLGQEDVSA